MMKKGLSVSVKGLDGEVNLAPFSIWLRKNARYGGLDEHE